MGEGRQTSPRSSQVQTATTPSSARAAADVDAGDPRVRDRAPQNGRMERAGRVDIVDVGAFAGQKARILVASDRFAEPSRASWTRLQRRASPGAARCTAFTMF